MLCGILLRDELLEVFKKEFKNIPDFTSVVILLKENKKCTYTFDGMHHYKVSLSDFEKYYNLYSKLA